MRCPKCDGQMAIRELQEILDDANATPLSLAITTATKAHDGQVDKSGQPYIFHPLRVMLALLGESEDVQIVAVLHDVIEDTSVTLQSIAGSFSVEVVAALDAITHMPNESNGEYMERVCANAIAKRVKLFDILDNMWPPRMSRLDVKTQARLTAKYKEMLRHLHADAHAAEGECWSRK